MSSEMPLARFFGNPAIPQRFKAVVFAVYFFGLPLVFLAGGVATIWLVSHFTDVFTAVYIGILAQIFAAGLIGVARRKLELKELLLFFLILGCPLPLFLFAAWLFRGY
jgi:hypothetical protein